MLVFPSRLQVLHDRMVCIVENLDFDLARLLILNDFSVRTVRHAVVY